VQIAKKGSAVLKHIREQQDRSKMREKIGELAGTNLGNILKIKKDKESDRTQKLLDSGEVDYKAEN